MEASTITRTLELGADTVERREVVTEIDGRATVTSRATVPYRITEHGTLVMASPRGEQSFTPIVADAAACAALYGGPCRALGWGGLLAQSPDRTRYRREYRARSQRPSGEHRVETVSTLRFGRSLRGFAGPGCEVELSVTTSVVVDGQPRRPATQHAALGCVVEPKARGALTRIRIRGYAPESDDRDTAEALRGAFEPVLYFDPADPWMLYFERPGDYRAGR